MTANKEIFLLNQQQHMKNYKAKSITKMRLQVYWSSLGQQTKWSSLAI